MLPKLKIKQKRLVFQTKNCFPKKKLPTKGHHPRSDWEFLTNNQRIKSMQEPKIENTIC